MPGQSVTLPKALPRSHYFLTVSRGEGMRTWAIRWPLVHVALAVLPLLALSGLGGGLYMAFHDDLVAGLMARQDATRIAYEDRIEGLRQDLERQTDLARSDSAKLETRLRDLLAREAKLEARASVVADLAGQGGATGSIHDRSVTLPPQITGRPAPLPAGVLGYAGSDKPHPLLDGAMSEAPRSAVPGRSSWLDMPDLPVADRLATADLALDRIELGQTGEVTELGGTARDRASRIRNLFESAGLSTDRYLGKTESGVGGPFVPLPEGPDGQFGRAVAELRGDLATATQLRQALMRVPLAMPLDGRLEVTSPFGARLDPFLGKPALHTGVDLREGYGTEIRATAAGRVVSAGLAGGYGNMVEVDHGSGIATRYAHMGRVAVAAGETVSRGDVLGYVGSTGRATGPHLHYEVRIDGEPVDPMRFLQIADRADTVSLMAGR